MKNPSDVLREAAEYISEHGWCQGQLYDTETGGVCAIGAIYSVCGVKFHRRADPTYPAVFNGLVVNEAARRLARQVNIPYVPHWNDRPERTKEDVVLAMKRAAAEEE